MSSTALFVVDIQFDLAQDPDSKIPHAGRVREVGDLILIKARAIARQPDLKIVFVQHEDKGGDGSLVRGSKSWQLVFPPRNSDKTEMLVPKNTRDAFESNPQLASQLKEEGVESIVVFGIQSECCVQATCNGALEAGFKVALLQGAHSTYDARWMAAEQIEKAVESELRSRGADVFSWDDW